MRGVPQKDASRAGEPRVSLDDVSERLPFRNREVQFLALGLKNLDEPVCFNTCDSDRRGNSNWQCHKPQYSQDATMCTLFFVVVTGGKLLYMRTNV